MPKDDIHPTLKLVTESNFAQPASQAALTNLLSLDLLLPTADRIFREEISDESDNDQASNLTDTFKQQFSKQEWKEEKRKYFNFKSVGKQRKWLHELLLSDSSDDDSDMGSNLDEGHYAFMCSNHLYMKKLSDRFCYDSNYYEDAYSFYGSSLISEHDKYHEMQKKRTKKDKTKHKQKMEKSKSNKNHIVRSLKKSAESRLEKEQMQLEKDSQCKRKKLWNLIIKKDLPKAYRNRMNNRGTNMQLLKKVAQACQREKRKEALRSQKVSKEALLRARRMAREMLLYWRKFDKVEKEHRKKAEKEAIEQRKHDEELREMKRQQRKLNFLITQTELYAHFMGKKMKGGNAAENQHDDILKKLENDPNEVSCRTVHGGIINRNIDDDYDASLMKSQAMQNVEKAVLRQQKNVAGYNNSKADMQSSFDGNFSLANPTLGTEQELPQPKIFEGRLKSYQLKGMNWLASLYEKGINGILADEMGLGKTVQSIVFLAYLAEVHNIWGPFLVVAPASTLHNWQQEFTKFLPRFKVLPYWGDTNDRKSLRKYWNQRNFYSGNLEEDSPFHVLITSYQLIVQDVKYMQRIRWQYLVLDEAHAIKSSQSLRWKVLLGYNCRNRLLLTGTPIQNSMAELWALLHFIMPTLFDNHDEFNEWFSKDIENHASEKRPNLDQNQLSRLHMILKPFMLRRVKKDVENELSDKIEIKMICEMSLRQKSLYQAVKNKILIEDLFQSSLTSSSSSTDSKSTSILMNLVMQFRKVCNHPELFERKEPLRGLNFNISPVPLSKLVFEECIFPELRSSQVGLYHKKLLIWNLLYISQSLKASRSCFGFTRFSSLSPKQSALLFLNISYRLLHILLYLMELEQQRFKKTWKRRRKSRFLSHDDFLIHNENSNVPSFLRFTNYNENISGHDSFIIRERISESTISSLSRSRCGCVEVRHCEPIYYPKFLITCFPKVNSSPPTISCSSRRAAYHLNERFISSKQLDKILRFGVTDVTSPQSIPALYPSPKQGFSGLNPIAGWSLVKLPDRSTLISDSGKLTVLDELLIQLKQNDHRVLIYSQMTKMIDLLEEFMNFRRYSYMRLDGSSKISERRDMVADFQSKQDIFAFLLSTRAGGLGINLTAADTVIFYDSDWNPTVDQQAMDRAHRLGQTKQVTVYRLVTKGTVEERILNRAREKSEIQSIVISGGEFNKDVLRPREVVSLLLDDTELERKLKQRQLDSVNEDGRSSRRKRQKNKNATAEVKDVPKKIKRGNSESKNLNLTELNTIEVLNMDETSRSSSVELGSYTSNTEDDKQLSRPPSSLSNRSPITVEGVKRKGRPPGKGRGKSKSGTLAKAAASAAALAGAVAGSTAAYAAYGYSFQASNGS